MSQRVTRIKDGRQFDADIDVDHEYNDMCAHGKRTGCDDQGLYTMWPLTSSGRPVPHSEPYYVCARDLDLLYSRT